MADDTIWKNRIVGYEDRDPATLTPNPRNWRVHPHIQASALSGILGEVGTVAGVIYNQRTGRLIDGHLRVELALKQKQPTVPTTIVDLDEHEEAAILATFDPITALAQADEVQLKALLEEVSGYEGELGAMIDRMKGEENDPGSEWQGMPEFEQEDATSFRKLIVHFRSAEDVVEFVRRLDVTITPQTLSLWFPPMDKEIVKDLRYQAE